MRVRACLCVVLFGAVLLPGCGRQDISPVRGKVTFKGRPVADAEIAFNPAPRFKGDKEPGKPATGYTDENGNYVLSTYRVEDGAHVGKHRVTVTVGDTNPVRCKRFTEWTLEVKPNGNELNIELSP